ncbi:MAG TPA: SDR family oxidoreductase [Solirubrobacterales bacterium]|jgi:uncharacterized protein YbjT (DUF2867 family)
MLVVIAGGHGKIAMRLAPLLTGDGHRVRSLIRNPDHAGDVGATGAEPIVCDLESAGDDEVEAAVRGADAIVFAAGAGPGSGAARKETVDYGGAVRMIAAAKATGVRRYVMISAQSADPDHPGDEVFDVYLRAKGRADAELRESGLDYTIVRPGRLTDDPGTGRVSVAERLPRGEVTRDDVAAVVAACLNEPATIGATFHLLGGDTPIAEALAGLAG